MKSDEFHEIAIDTGGKRPLMSRPPRLVASKKFIREVQAELRIEDDDQAREAADWVLDKMERFGARTAQPMFDMDGNGPSCSWCGMIWPLCGHHHLSEENDDEPEQEAA